MAEMFRVFPLSPGLIDGKHRRNMGLAIWEFLWFLEHVTSDEPDGKGKFDGVVDFDNPIGPAKVAQEIGSNVRSVQKNIQKLISTGYLIRKRKLANGNSYVVKNSKRWLWKREHLTRIPTSSPPNSANDLDAGARLNQSPEVNDSVTRGERFVRSNKESKSRRAEEKNKILKPSPNGAEKKATSNPSRSKGRGPGKSLSKSSHRSGDSSTDQGKENSAGAAAAKLSSPGELVLTPPASSLPKESRHGDVERFIKSTYQEANDGVQCAWNGRDGKMLKAFLVEHSSWPIEKITQCVANRFKSDGVSLSADPHSWISDLASFLHGPKDKYGKTRAELAAAPKTKAPRPVENVPPPIRQPDNDALIESWKRNRIGRVQ